MDTEKIKELRERTGSGLNDCKIALEYTNGDIEKAVEVLRYAATRFLSNSEFKRIFSRKD